MYHPQTNSDPMQPQSVDRLEDASRKRRMRIADAMRMKGKSNKPIIHPLEAVGNAAQQISGAYAQRKMNEPEGPTQLLPRNLRVKGSGMLGGRGKFGGMVKRGLSGLLGGGY